MAAAVGETPSGLSRQPAEFFDTATRRASPRRRVVLLGASNLTRGISTVVGTARRVWGGPLDVLAALGHGRSYGQHSRIIVRTLPGIDECGLWTALAQRPQLPTAALVTDVGNDLFFEVPVPTILEWVGRCLDRLDQVQARTVIARPPVCNLPLVRPWQFRLIRQLFFPRCRLSFGEILNRAGELDLGLLRLAEKHGSAVVEPVADWYGWDPIHIRLAHWHDAWSVVLAPWGDGSGDRSAPRARGSVARWTYLRTRPPASRWIFGLEQRRRQPCGELADGTRISLF